MATITPAAVFPLKSGGGFETSPAYSGTFIPTIWASRLVENFYAASTFAACSNTNWEGDITAKGDKVIINSVPVITIADYDGPGSTLTYQVPTPSTQELLIDQAKKYAFQINDVLVKQSQLDQLGEFTKDAAQRMQIAVDTDCWLATFDGAAAANKGATAGAISAGFNLGTDAAPVTLDADNILEQILAMASVLDEQNVPNEGRWLVMTPADRYLLMNSKLAQAYVTGDATSIVRNGKVGMIDRFELYVSNLLPKAALNYDWDGVADPGTAKRHAIVAGHKSAITFASQFVKTETLRNPTDFGDLIRGLKVYGRKVVKPEGLTLTVAAG